MISYKIYQLSKNLVANRKSKTPQICLKQLNEVIKGERNLTKSLIKRKNPSLYNFLLRNINDPQYIEVKNLFETLFDKFESQVNPSKYLEWMKEAKEKGINTRIELMNDNKALYDSFYYHMNKPNFKNALDYFNNNFIKSNNEEYNQETALNDLKDLVENKNVSTVNQLKQINAQLYQYCFKYTMRNKQSDLAKYYLQHISGSRTSF